jgi:GNAT superfamily N-acetyltransferase
MDFTTNDEIGLLVEGYDLRPMILQPWHPPYYRELIEGHGFSKEIDLLMWWLQLGELKEGSEFHPMIHAAAEKVETEHGITIRNMNKRDLVNEERRFMEVYTEAWGDNWGFVPPTDAEMEVYAKNLKPVLEERWTFIAERDGEVLGAALTLPDINQVLAKMNGRLLPFGWLRFLLGKRKIDKVRVFALGVKPAYQHTGIAAAFYIRHLDEADPDEVYGGETGWILETNEPMNRAMEGMGGRVVKKYRIYEKGL